MRAQVRRASFEADTWRDRTSDFACDECCRHGFPRWCSRPVVCFLVASRAQR